MNKIILIIGLFTLLVVDIVLLLKLYLKEDQINDQIVEETHNDLQGNKRN